MCVGRGGGGKGFKGEHKSLLSLPLSFRFEVRRSTTHSHAHSCEPTQRAAKMQPQAALKVK